MSPLLAGLRVNIVSSGHDALDHRLFDKEARSLKDYGACVRIIAPYSTHEVRDDVEIVPVPTPTSRLQRFFITPWQCLKIGLKYPADVWHIQDAEMLSVCPALKSLSPGVRILYDVHEDFPELIARREWLPVPTRKLVKVSVRLFEGMMVRTVDGVIGATDPLAERFKGKPRIAVYNLPSRRFMEAAKKALRAPEGRPFAVVHLGVLSEERLYFLESILAQMIDHTPGFRALVIGTTPAQSIRLSQRFTRDRVEVCEKVPYPEIPNMLTQATVGLSIHPIPYPHLNVAMPVKVFEYMACGCCVIASFMPVLGTLLDGVSLPMIRIIQSAEVQPYLEAIRSLLSTPPQTLSEYQSLLVALSHRRYSWEAEAEKLVGFYHRILDARIVETEP